MSAKLKIYHPFFFILSIVLFLVMIFFAVKIVLVFTAPYYPSSTTDDLGIFALFFFWMDLLEWIGNVIERLIIAGMYVCLLALTFPFFLVSFILSITAPKKPREAKQPKEDWERRW